MIHLMNQPLMINGMTSDIKSIKSLTLMDFQFDQQTYRHLILSVPQIDISKIQSKSFKSRMVDLKDSWQRTLIKTQLSFKMRSNNTTMLYSKVLQVSISMLMKVDSFPTMQQYPEFKFQFSILEVKVCRIQVEQSATLKKAQFSFLTLVIEMRFELQRWILEP